MVHAGIPSAIPRDELAIRVVIPDDLKTERIDIPDLPSDWQETDHPACLIAGDGWIARGGSAVLDVPSAVVPQERNLVLNPKHPAFKRIDISDPGVPFRWDPRIVSFLTGSP